MNTIKFEDKKNIKMVAHRGVSGLERENTCPAFVAAGVKTYYGIETDVHVTVDKRYIIHHDDSVKRLTGLDLLIRDTDFDTLRQLRMKDIDNETERADLFFPTLDEYLSICKKYEKVAVLELKEEMAEEDVAAIAKAVDDAGMMDRTTFISFSRNNLLYLRQAYAGADAQYLSSSVAEDTVSFILDNNFDADIDKRALTKEFVDIMHANGRAVNVWTVNTLEDARALAAMGVDMITTNILE